MSDEANVVVNEGSAVIQTWEERVKAKLEEFARITDELGEVFEEKLAGSKAMLYGASAGMIRLLRQNAATRAAASTPDLKIE